MSEPASWWTPRPEGIELRIRAVPGARRSGIAGLLGDRLKVRVAAPPEDGRANEAILRLLAERLGVATHALSIRSGHASRDKSILVRGVAPAALDALRAD